MMPATGEKRPEIFRVSAEAGEVLADLDRVPLPRFLRIIDGVVGVAVPESRRDLAASWMMVGALAKGETLLSLMV
jgi:hypothetical protein